MKKLVYTLLITLCAFTLKAQTYQYLTNPGNTGKVRGPIVIDGNTWIATDTLPVPLSLQNIPALAGKGDTIYRYSPISHHWIPVGSAGAVTWGSITGILSSQTDLQNALNLKQNKLTPGTTSQYYDGTLTLRNFTTAVQAVIATNFTPIPRFLDSMAAHTTRMNNMGFYAEGPYLFKKPAGNNIGDKDTLAFQNNIIDSLLTGLDNVNSFVESDPWKIISFVRSGDSVTITRQDGTSYSVYDPIGSGGLGTTYTTTDNAMQISGSVISTRKTPQAATDGATITLNAALGFTWKVTIAGNRTLAISNAQDGDIITLYIVQDVTGGRTMTWPSGTYWINAAGAPTLKAAGQTDRVVFQKVGTTWYGSY